jgi:O-antigen ligase
MFVASVFRLLPASLALIPLIIAPGILFYFDLTPKVAVLLLTTGLWLFFAKPNTLGVRALVASRDGRWFIGLLCAQAVSIVISTACADDVALAITGSAWRRGGAVVEIGVLIFSILLAARMAGSPDSIRFVLRSCMAACLLAALYGIAQFFGIDPFLPAKSYHAGEGIWTIVRPPSTLGNANYFANYLIYATCFSAALIFGETVAGWRWFAATACGAGVIAIVLSGARAGMLGLALGMAILAACGTARWRKRLIVSGLCAGALLAALAVSPPGLPLRARIRWSREDALGGGRLLLWRDSTRMFATHWLVGFGPEQFSREFPRFQSLELAQVHPDFYQESPHNFLLDAALAQGVPGIFLTMATLALGFVAAWNKRTSQSQLSLCLAAGLAGGTICALFSPPVPVTHVYQLTAIAILCAAGSRVKPENAGVPAIVRPLGWLAGVALLFFGIALLVSDIHAESFRRLVQSEDIEGAVARYRIVTRSALPGFSIDLYASRVLAQVSLRSSKVAPKLLAWQEALRAGERATQTTEDRQNAFYNLAQLYARQNDLARTEHSLRLAIRVAPNWFKPHWILAELLKQTGRFAEARQEVRIAMVADAGKDPEVVRAWEELGSPR